MTTGDGRGPRFWHLCARYVRRHQAVHIVGRQSLSSIHLKNGDDDDGESIRGVRHAASSSTRPKGRTETRTGCPTTAARRRGRQRTGPWSAITVTRGVRSHGRGPACRAQRCRVCCCCRTSTVRARAGGQGHVRVSARGGPRPGNVPGAAVDRGEFERRRRRRTGGGGRGGGNGKEPRQ